MGIMPTKCSDYSSNSIGGNAYGFMSYHPRLSNPIFLSRWNVTIVTAKTKSDKSHANEKWESWVLKFYSFIALLTAKPFRVCECISFRSSHASPDIGSTLGHIVGESRDTENSTTNLFVGITVLLKYYHIFFFQTSFKYGIVLVSNLQISHLIILYNHYNFFKLPNKIKKNNITFPNFQNKDDIKKSYSNNFLFL